MARYLFIVSRQHQALHDYLLERFSGDTNAQVILNRRRGERRQRKILVTLERRGVDRRQLAHIEEELRHRSVAIVTIP